RPQCRDLSAQKRTLKRRSVSEITVEGTAEVDVRAQQLDVLDPQIDFGLSGDDSRLEAAIRKVRRPSTTDCVPTMTVTVGASLCVTLVLALLTVIVYLKRRTPLKR
ncbi:unnamed protein product, partial [Toxocara canis]|uniref:F5/8 type C domain-containing protein n=1 Tax=Toxocara canis TaxID=6265 RepID=A0A183U4T0_TOXCA